jgi:hypothetical protein
MNEHSLKVAIEKIADDYYPDSDKDAPLALQQMRDALREALAAIAPKQQAQAGEAEQIADVILTLMGKQHIDWVPQGESYEGEDDGGFNSEKDERWYLLHLVREALAALQPQPQVVDEREAFEKWARKESDRLGLELAKDMTCCDGRFPATYREQETETAWRAWANKPRASLAQPTVAAEQGGLTFIGLRFRRLKDMGDEPSDWSYPAYQFENFREGSEYLIDEGKVWTVQQKSQRKELQFQAAYVQNVSPLEGTWQHDAHPAAVQRDEQERDALAYLRSQCLALPNESLLDAVKGVVSSLYQARDELESAQKSVRALKTAKAGEQEAKPEQDAILTGLKKAVEAAKEDGMWHPCSGCYETEDGHAVGRYPFSDALGCSLGSGCRECGGLGATWEDFSGYEDLAEDEDAAHPQAEAQSKDKP